MTHPPLTRHVIGCMAGTSLDGLDLASVRIQGEGLTLTPTLLQYHHCELDNLTHAFQQLTTGQHPVTPIELAQTARQFGSLHVHAIQQLKNWRQTDFVVAHGQTLWHDPDQHLSVQLFDPWPIVHQLRLPVCWDLRQADLIAGGQGAPITPLADWILYRHTTPRVIVNLGGICNVTYLPQANPQTAPSVPPGEKTSTKQSANPCDFPEGIRGGDLGPCNLLIDSVVQICFEGLLFDRDGQLTAQGRADPRLYERMSRETFFQAQEQDSPRSTGRETFNRAWAARLLAQLNLAPHDAVASAVHAAATLIATSPMVRNTPQVILAGGGAKNPQLVQAIKKQLPHHEILLSDELGIPCHAREAMAMAVLGTLCRDGLPITSARTTGATTPVVAGNWAGLFA